MGESRERRDDVKSDGSEIHLSVKSPFLSWLDNFWYHHKWKVIIVAFFLTVAIVGIVQMLGKEECDASITVATHTIYYRENVDALEQALVSLMPSDRTGDGKKLLQLDTYKIYSEDEMKAVNEAETDINGYPIIYADESYNKSQLQDYNSSIMSGECTVMFISEYLYSELVDRRADDVLLKPMSEIFDGELPSGVMPDGYGIKLSETRAYSYFEAFQALPSDTVVCIMRPFAFGASSNTERYDFAVQYFKNIINFGE